MALGLHPDAVVSGLALVGSGLFPWASDGPGSSLRGIELARALQSTAGLPDWAPQAALAIMAVSAIGVFHLASAPADSPVVHRLRFASGCIVIVGLVALGLGFGPGQWGPGVLCAAVGALVAVTAGLRREIQMSRGR